MTDECTGHENARHHSTTLLNESAMADEAWHENGGQSGFRIFMG